MKLMSHPNYTRRIQALQYLRIVFVIFLGISVRKLGQLCKRADHFENFDIFWRLRGETLFDMRVLDTGTSSFASRTINSVLPIIKSVNIWTTSHYLNFTRYMVCLEYKRCHIVDIENCRNPQIFSFQNADIWGVLFRTTGNLLVISTGNLSNNLFVTCE